MRRRSPDTHRERLPFEIWALVAAAFTMSLGFGVLAPTIPQFALEFHVSNFWASSLISILAITRIVGAPLGSWMMARFGERATYTAGMMISAVTTGLCAVVVTFPQLFALRGIAGFGSVLTTIATTALIIKLSPRESRGRVASLNAAGFMSGALLGPVFGAMLIPFGLRAPFVFQFFTIVIAMAVVWFALRKSTIVVFDRTQNAAEALTNRQALGIPQYRALLVSTFTFNWATYGVRNSVVPLFAVAMISSDPATAAWVLAAYSLGNTIFIIPAGRWNDTIGRKPILITGMAISTVGYLVFPFATELWFALAVMVFAGIGSALLNPGQQAVLADVVGQRNAGGVISFYSVFGDVGFALGPIVAGLIVDLAGFEWAFFSTALLLGLTALAWAVVPDSRKLGN